MKKSILVLLLFLFILPTSVFAHMVGQPPFFKINGVYSNLYPVPTSSSPDYNLPQDLADKNFLINQNLEMMMDVSQLPILPEVVSNTKFEWDFGDGSKGEGLKNTHVYTKAGSYILTVTAKYGKDEPQLIQSVLINVLPDPDYKLPIAKIVAQGKESKDPLTDVLQIDLKKAVEFDSSKSTGQIVEYFWDFGDGNSAKEANPTHKYDLAMNQVFPVLRVKDNQGFIADSYVELDGTNQSSTEGGAKPVISSINWSLIGIGLIVMLAIVSIWILKSKIKK